MKKFALAAAIIGAASSPALAATPFDLEGVAVGYSSSFVVNDGSLSLTVSSTTPGAFVFVGGSGVGLIGRGVIGTNTVPLQGFQFAPLKFAFNQAISSITFNFGDGGGDDDNAVLIEAYSAADVLLGSFTTSYDAGFAEGKSGTLNFAGATYFIASSGSADRNINSIFWDISAVTVGGTGGVPEPAAWAMMLAGFGLVGGAMRRRGTMVTA